MESTSLMYKSDKFLKCFFRGRICTQKFAFIRLKAERVKLVAGLIERSDPFLSVFPTEDIIRATVK